MQGLLKTLEDTKHLKETKLINLHNYTSLKENTANFQIKSPASIGDLFESTGVVIL